MLDFSFIDDFKNDTSYKEVSNTTSTGNSKKPYYDVRWVGLDDNIVGESLEFAIIPGKVKTQSGSIKTSIERKVEYFPLKSRFKPQNSSEYINANIKIEATDENTKFITTNVLNIIPETDIYLYRKKVVYYILGLNLKRVDIDPKFAFESDKLTVYVFQDRLYSSFKEKLVCLSNDELKKVCSGKAYIKVNFSKEESTGKNGKVYTNIVVSSINCIDDPNLESKYINAIDTLDKNEYDGFLSSLYLSPDSLDLTESKQNGIKSFINETYFKSKSFATVEVKEPTVPTNINTTASNVKCLIKDKVSSGEITKEEYEKYGSPDFKKHPSTVCPHCNECPYEPECIGL